MKTLITLALLISSLNALAQTSYIYNYQDVISNLSSDSELVEEEVVDYLHVAHCADGDGSYNLKIKEGAAKATEYCQNNGGLKRIVKTTQVIVESDEVLLRKRVSFISRTTDTTLMLKAYIAPSQVWTVSTN